MRTYAFTVLSALVFSLSCAHEAADGDGCDMPYAQVLSSSSDCQPNSDIEKNPKKQESFRLVRSHCQTEINKLCQEVECPQLMKPTQVCLMMNEDELSQECKKDLNRHIKAYQPYLKSLKE